ncbi:LCCL domain-containing protein [Plectosphaerella plurivora]|uniref:LCCL domain-containing protein n=1 Tax=Plectosphaerella plurivora TaxID=936078 RepID=A0A9P8V932_9PEZI|nr:LCCL domain-containing protein [Plectosphaerella plurivora]
MPDEASENTPLLMDMDRQDRDPENPAERTNGAADKTTASTTTTSADHPDAPIAGVSSSVDTAPDAAGQRRAYHVEVEDESAPSTPPRFVQDEGAWKRWKWVPYPVRRFARKVAIWSRGPENPRPWKITPLLPRVQEFPLELVDRFLPKRRQRILAVCFYIAIWVVTFALVKRQETFASEISGWGLPQEIGCGATFWSAGNRCGIDGVDCRPFDNSGFPFRCPANCHAYQVLNPRAVGDQEILYTQFVIGGNNETHKSGYRGDSHICGSGIHAGVVSNSLGGCGVVRIVGEQSHFPSSRRHDVTSVGFDSYFPLAFVFDEDATCGSKDMRWDLLAVSLVFSIIFSLFIQSPALFFFVTYTGLFWHVGMASDPPKISTIAGLVSNLLGKFLPATFCAWVFYDKMGIRRTLKGLTAQVEKTVLWLGACWVGALTNYTLDFIPISRLTAHDLQQQPGAKAALAIIVIVLFCIVCVQVWFFRQEGRMIKYLKLYALLLGGILLSLTLPELNLRIHHYILAMLLLPGTSMQTRPCLLFQGLLVGLFINGIARWGFDPVLQTSSALQGDAPNNSPLPIIAEPLINLTTTAAATAAAAWTANFTWTRPDATQYDGLSVLVNDVERFRTYFDDSMFTQNFFLWERDPALGMNEYFRFAYMEGSRTWDYTKAGVWTADGEWKQMGPGPSRVMARDLADAADERMRRR